MPLVYIILQAIRVFFCDLCTLFAINVLCSELLFVCVHMSTKELISPGGVNCQACQSELSGGRVKMWTLGLLSILVAAGAARGAILMDRDLNTRPIIGMHCKEPIPKIRNKNSQKKNCASTVLISTFMCLCERFIYIPKIDPHILLQSGPILRI